MSRVRMSAAMALLVAGAAAAAAFAAVPRCDGVAGNLVRNCGFDNGVQGWRSQAVTTIAFDPRHGVPAPGALRMTNQPASEAGASTCVVVPGGPAFEVSGYLQRLDGPGDCLALVEEHTTTDCSKGATAFHELANRALVRGTFTEVRGSTALRRDTVAVRAGFACYGEHDDDVQSVLLDNVTLRRVDPAPDAPSGGGR